MTSFVTNQINRTNRNLLLLSVALLAAFGVIAYFGARYISNLLQGPRPISAGELAAITDPSTIERYYVTVTGDDIINTGIVQVTTSERRGVRRETTDAGFYILKVGEHIVLLEQKNTEDESGNTTFSGTLEAIPDDEKREILNTLFLRFPELESRALPFKIDARPYATEAHYFLIAVVVAAGLLGAFNLARVILRMTNRNTHPLMQRLAALGDAPALAAEIDAQLPANARGKLVLSSHWLARLSLFGADLTRMQDLTWVHAVRKQRKAGNVVTRETGALVYYDRAGKRTTVDFEKDLNAVTTLSAELRDHAPWAVHGHSPEIEAKWQKERDSFIHWIDQRRTEAQRMGTAA
jgi:hypothetical protein